MKDETTDLKEDCDWRAAFRYADAGVPSAVAGYAGSTATFEIDDIARVVAREDGENDGASWLAVAQLADGRWVFLDAGCDYTGWD